MTSAIRGMWHHLAQQPESYERKQYYTFGRVLGAGTFGEVREAVFTPDGRHVAIKVIKKSGLSGDEAMVLKEIDIVRHLHHPNIVKLLDWFESKDKYYLVFELCTGGELFEEISKRGHFSEEDATNLIRCGYDSISYLHDHNIVHRDIKPENFIFKDRSRDAPLMLADFGIARIMKSDDEVLSTMCGSFGYAAPEVLLRKGHGKAVDVWSMGVVTFSILCGYSPFWRFEEHKALMTAMLSDNIEFIDTYWWGISDNAKDFIRRSLKSNPDERMTAREALQHPWLTGESASTRDLLPDVLHNFNARATLRRAVLKLQAVNRLRKLSHGPAGRSLSDSSSTSDHERPQSSEMDVDQAGKSDGPTEKLEQQQSPEPCSPPTDPKDTVPGSWVP
ncbi:Calmodulin-dependent protein kinase cmk2 [Coemansia aciculifera]|uniref:Calmodulin-dependent protein kinase cmk2 n=1 Tax=Coemansia aciculifera TaxID=417176 RepID=A0ACC1MBZ7_9FUNG|nr:Calmodulin-dependent protein kinase cmk2 [Coemansia aciculifera]